MADPPLPSAKQNSHHDSNSSTRCSEHPHRFLIESWKLPSDSELSSGCQSGLAAAQARIFRSPRHAASSSHWIGLSISQPLIAHDKQRRRRNPHTSDALDPALWVASFSPSTNHGIILCTKMGTPVWCTGTKRGAKRYRGRLHCHEGAVRKSIA